MTEYEHIPGEHILNISFSPNYKQFVCATTHGFIVYEMDPIQFAFKRNLEKSVGHVRQLDTSNLFAIVGAENSVNPFKPPNIFNIWDDSQKIIIKEITFDTNIKGIQFNRSIICIALENKIQIYRFSDFSPITTMPTYPNPHGILSLATFDKKHVLAFPCAMTKDGPLQDPHNSDRHDLLPGYARILRIKSEEITHSLEWSDVQCHESPIRNIQVTPTFRVITASERGTLIHIYTAHGSEQATYRRGSDGTTIYSASISSDNSLLAVVSKKNNVHIYNLKEDNKNTHSMLSYMGNILPKYFSDKWSMQTISVTNPNDLPIFCAFSGNIKEHNVLYIICQDGRYFKYIIDGSEAKQDYHTNFLSVE